MAEVMKRFNGTDWGTVSAVNRMVVETIIETPDERDYRVRFIDYDGTVLKTVYCNTGESAAPPASPAHEGLTFQGWNFSSAELANVIHDLDVGATFITTDEKTHFHITLNAVIGLTPTIYFSKSSASSVASIEWGDGTTETVSASGSFSRAHTYSAYGDYVIKLWLSGGAPDLIGLGNTSAAAVGGSSVYKSALTSVNLGHHVTILGDKAFYSNDSLVTVSLPYLDLGVTYVQASAFENCYRLKALVFPINTDLINANTFKGCYSLQVVSLPNSITMMMYDGIFNSCQSLESIVIPDNVTRFGNYTFYNCFMLSKVHLPAGITSLGNYAFNQCYALAEVVLPTALTKITPNNFYGGYSLKSMVVPSNVTILDTNAFTDCHALETITIPASVTSIGAGALSGCISLKELIVQQTTPPTLNSTALTAISVQCKIKVPSASLTAYQTATNWSTYRNYMEGY